MPPYRFRVVESCFSVLTPHLRLHGVERIIHLLYPIPHFVGTLLRRHRQVGSLRNVKYDDYDGVHAAGAACGAQGKSVQIVGNASNI